MIEKPKRPKKIPNQDNKQPQTIQELIRRYDLDNTKIYDFLDELTLQINLDINKVKEEMTGKILYEDTEGKLNDIPLIQGKSNFADIEIIYGRNDARMSTGRIPSESTETKLQEFGAINLYFKTLTLNETSLTSDYYRTVAIADGTATETDALYIYKVIGYYR